MPDFAKLIKRKIIIFYVNKIVSTYNFKFWLGWDENRSESYLI